MGILQDQQIGLAAWVCLGFEKLEFRLQLCSPARCNNGRRYVGDGRRRRLADIGAPEVAQKCKGGPTSQQVFCRLGLISNERGFYCSREPGTTLSMATRRLISLRMGL